MTDTPLRLFNSLTRQLETFAPIHEGEARVYSCGPTVYNYPHIGNMRAYVFADVLGRTLSWKGYRLTHVINITDVGHLTDDADAGEDKLEKMAAEKAQSIRDIARHYTEAFQADIKALNIREPARWTVATDYVPQMIEFAKGIADKHCYQLDSGLYFDVSTVPDYGRLARASTDAGDPGGESRIEPVEGKRNAADFAIWRKTPPGETRQMEWDSPWGRGAPGWHLECSVMSGAVSPLMLIALGLSLRWDTLRFAQAWPITIVALIQLVLMPVWVWLAARLFGLSGDTLTGIVLEAAMPSMVLGLVICDRYGLDTSLYAAAVTVTTAISFITLPLWFALL